MWCQTNDLQWPPPLVGADQFTTTQMQFLLCMQWPLTTLGTSKSNSTPKKTRTKYLI